MIDLFQNIMTASFHGGIMIVAVLILRSIPVKIPRKYICLLWLLTGIRLLLPFEIQSQFSIQPEIAPIILKFGWFPDIAPYIWIGFTCCFMLYILYTYIRMKWRVRDAMQIPGGWESDKIETAFVLGFVRPKIYIPMGMPQYANEHILAHERTHLDKGDHWFKMIGYLALALHWFNPFVWVAYICLSKDIEIACDERVIQFMDVEERRAYASSLLCCSSNHAHYAASPVAFGEISVKGRIQSVMKYRRPHFIISFLSILAICFVAICLFTMPASQRTTLEWAQALNAEDIAFVEAISQLEESADPYQKIEGDAIEPFVGLIQSCQGEYWDAQGNLPETQETILVTMLDGTTHTVANSDNRFLIIDNDVYTASTKWLDSWDIGGIREPETERPRSTSEYVRQRWAQDLQITDVARIELVCNDQEKPYSIYTGEALAPLVELLNSIDGEFVANPIVSGNGEDIYLSKLYVFMEDDTRYTIIKMAGADCNYICIDNSVFVCDDTLFAKFPEIGTSPFPENHIIAGDPSEEKIPKDQRSKPPKIAAETSGPPAPEGYAAYDWMVNLKAEDVDYIEFIKLSDPNTPYLRYEGDEIQEVIEIFQTNQCYKYAPIAQWSGDYTSEFHIILKDGSAHKIGSIQTVTTVIDGAAFDTISAWLIQKWPETGVEPLPDNWNQLEASRVYHVEEREKSILSTESHDSQRASLDHEYNTDINMGSVSRHYSIGRGGIELAAVNETATGLTLEAYWWSSADKAQVSVKPQYWLEQWHEDVTSGAKGYSEVDTKSLISRSEVQMIAQDTASWDVNWEDTYGTLAPGYYRIGMNFYETADDTIQNETICYAKFCIPDKE